MIFTHFTNFSLAPTVVLFLNTLQALVERGNAGLVDYATKLDNTLTEIAAWDFFGKCGWGTWAGRWAGRWVKSQLCVDVFFPGYLGTGNVFQNGSRKREFRLIQHVIPWVC